MTTDPPGCECDRFGAVDCTSCRICETVCPSRLDLARVVATSRRLEGVTTSHQGLFTALATLEAQGAATSLGHWHASRPGVRTGSDAVFFPGTAALMDPFFARDTEYARGPHAALLLINAAGVEPRVVGGGSGHDLWYQGAFEEFEALSARLVPVLEEAIAATGGGPVVCSSAEDAHALRDLHEVDAVHISQYLTGEGIGLPGAGVEGDAPKVAFFDPCRLGRYSGEYDAPRQLLAGVAEVVDLGWTRGEEPCCGVSAWVNCNAWSKDHRRSVLERAHEAGVDVLVTGCPMCQVHLECYYTEEGYDPEGDGVVPPIRIADLSQVMAELMGLLPQEGDRLEEPTPKDDAGLMWPVERRPDAHWLDEDTLRATHLCTLCLRCVQECPQDAPVLDHMNRVRQGIWNADLSPPSLVRMVESITTEGDPFGEPRDLRTEAYPPAMAHRVIEEEEDRTPDVLVFLGCVDSYQDPRVLSAISRVLEAAGVDYAVLGKEEGCCGYVDHLAGAEVSFAEVARDRMGAIVATGAGILVTPCAGCFRTFSRIYQEVDPTWPGQLEVLHLVEYMDRLIAHGDLRLAKEGKVRMVAYHDACDLGRHCGVYDAPRRVLSALPGVVLEEFPSARRTAQCCGGGGALRAFDTGTSLDIAADRLGGLVEGIDMVATGCPSCKGNLRLAATRLTKGGRPRLKVVDVVELVAASLAGGEDG